MSDRGGREGQHLGNYRLTRLLDAGGFAEVYLGEHVYLNTQAAIKVLHARLTSEASESFMEEARHLSHLVHPHVIRVLDFGIQDDTPFLVMDYAPHGSLRQRHPKGTSVALSSVVLYARQIAAALQYAHNQKLIHRDVKPENMLLGPNGEVLLSDFGIALLAPDSASLHVPEMVGTMAYMAPEQVRGKPVPASDQYALGVVVYEWLCGERPFSGSVSELFSQHLFAQPPPLHDKLPEIPLAVEVVVLRALAKDAQLRFEDVQAFATALEEASNAAASSNTLFVSGDNPPAAQPEVPPKKPFESASTPPFLNTPPFHVTSLVGREREVQIATQLMQRTGVRLLTVTGPGGVGKTRLALEIAADLRPLFPDGVCFVALAPINDPDLVVPTIAQALGLKEGGDQSLLEHASAFLREKRLLLVLDNFEQIVAGAPQLAGLLAACPKVKMLITSRALLHIEGEHEFPLSPLALPDAGRLSDLAYLSHSAAVALFVQRAQALKHDFELTTENAPTIAAICMRLDGLPLALELAAARIKLLPLQALLARLTRRLVVLTGGRQDAPARQQTLRNTIAWSYDLLTAGEQQLFRRLSVFVGGCTLEAVEALYEILGGEAASSVLDEVASLLDKSLLMQIEHRNDEPRLMLLETIREFGWERLEANSEMEVTRDTHAAYYLHLAEEAEPQLTGAEQERWWERLDREQENMRAALRWLLRQGEEKKGARNIEQALRQGAALWRYWDVRGHLSEGRGFLEQALAGSEGVAPAVRAKALNAAARLAVVQGDYDLSETLAGESLALYRERGDTRGIALSLSSLARVAFERGNTAAARALFEESAALCREGGDEENLAWSLFCLAWLAFDQGDYTTASPLYQQSLGLYRQRGNKSGMARTLLHSARLLLVSQGDPATVRSLLEEGLALFQEVGDKQGMADAWYFFGQFTFSQGESARANVLTRESVRLYREMGDRHGLALSLTALAGISAAQGDAGAARALYEEGLALGRTIGDKAAMAFSLEGLADGLVAQGEPERAARLWGAAEVLREALGGLPAPVDRAGHEQAVASAHHLLGEQAFATAWTQGRSMTPEQALAAREPQAIPGERVPVAPPRPPASPAPSYPAGLSAREVEVLRLVAQGLSNAQIAQRLIISPYTVNAHMRSIYSKLEVSSRIAVMQYAARHNLL